MEVSLATQKQELGERGERLVVKECACPRCKRPRTLRQRRANFKCADIICDFCGFLGQVKASRQTGIDSVPAKVLGAAWGPMKERLDAGLYFPLFLVLVPKEGKGYSIWYLSADLQEPEMFEPRNPLGHGAKRAGWQGFNYNLKGVRERFTRLV